jgi:tetratricopeptide (TPR) repeat protein/KaiC/GvpD/RAD55 family RecA-like ATPase
MDGVPPYILWKEVIRDYLETCTPEQLYRVVGFYPAEVAKLVPEISQKLRTIPQSFQISPEQEQSRLFEAVSQFVTNIAREAPLLVVLDDLQWTDPSSLLLLHYLARGVQKTSLLLLGAYRSTDIDSKHPLSPVLAELNRERLPESIQLKRMSLSDVSEMMRSILEQEDVPAEFCNLVYEKTKGNPFFAEEVVKSLKEDGVIYREGNKWAFKDVSSIEFPESVRNVLKARLSRLDEDGQSVLTMASFIGNDFTLEALCAVTGIEEDKLLKLMDELFKTGLIKEQIVRGEGVCSFADVLVRDVVYEEVSPLTRKKLHGVVGCALEKVYAETIDEHFGELASHLLDGGDRDKALDYFLKAGDRALKVYANSEAVSYFQSALKLLEAKREKLREKMQVLQKLGDIKSIVGEYHDSLKYWNEALLLSLKLSEKQNAARLHDRMTYILWHDLGAVKEAKEHGDEAIRILEELPESAEQARAYSHRAQFLWHEGDHAGTVSWAEKALELSTKLGAFDVMAESYTNLALALEDDGKAGEATEYLEKALKIALDNGYFETAMRIYNNLAAATPAMSEKSLEYCEKGYALAKKVGSIRWICWLGTSLAYQYANMGRMSEAFQLVEEAVALNRKTGSLTDLHYAVTALGLGYQVLGEWDKSEQYLEEAMEIAKTLNLLPRISYSYDSLAGFYLETGEYAKALEFYKKANEIHEKTGDKPSQMGTTDGLARAYIGLGETEKAGNLLESLEKFALEIKDRQRAAEKDALQAMFFRVQKRWDESAALFEKNLKELEDLGARRWNIYAFAKRVLYEYALTLLERNQEGDKEKARDLLSQALEMFQRMGAKKDIENVEARIAFIETGKAVSKPKPPEPVSTGYADLDKLLYGGIPSNYAVVLTSPSCDERDWLIKSFLEAGAKKGEVTFFVTIDPSVAKLLAEEYQSNFYLFVCNPEADAIIKSSPNVFTLKGVENLTDISIALTSAVRKLDSSLKNPRRICMSLVSDVLLQHHAVETRRWLTAVMTKLKSEGFTTLAVMDPEMHPPQEVRAVLDLFEGEISIFKKETGKGPAKYLKIQRMSNQKYLEDELPLKREQA